MEDFRKELDALLQKYPSLPEFKLTVRPRVVIETLQQPDIQFAYTQAKQESSVPSPVIPFTEALNAADATIAAITSRNPSLKIYEQ